MNAIPQNDTDHHLQGARRMIGTLRASGEQGTLDFESFDARLRAVEDHLTGIEAAIARGNPPPRATVPLLGTIDGGAR